MAGSPQLDRHMRCYQACTDDDGWCMPSSSQLISRSTKLYLAGLFDWIDRTIWRERNRRIFNSKETTVNMIFERIKDEAAAWIMAGAKHLSALLARY
uniref:Uncharacterized protein n=1 Tax=Setaria viridis TaxID=4556 RepID=A0A4U6TIR5_SETVI|nr:hypothetical protein SEVIR_9G479700v2 [Setaria viridis]